MTDDLHTKVTRHARQQRAKYVTAFAGIMFVFTAYAWLLFQSMQSEGLGLRFIPAEIVDIQTIDDGKGVRRNIVVRYEGRQMMFETDDRDFVGDIQSFVCLKEWTGVPIPEGPTPRYQALALPGDCVEMDATD